MISGTVICVIICIIIGIFFHRLSYEDYCRDRKFTESGCTVWANVRHLRSCESRSATRSSHSFCLTGELLSPNPSSDVKRNLSQGAESRIAHSLAHWRGASLEGIRKEKLRFSNNSLGILAGDTTFALLPFAQECSYAILPSTNCGLSTRGFFAAWKIWPQGDRVQVAPRSENWSVTDLTAICPTNCWASLSQHT